MYSEFYVGLNNIKRKGGDKAEMKVFLRRFSLKKREITKAIADWEKWIAEDPIHIEVVGTVL